MRIIVGQLLQLLYANLSPKIKRKWFYLYFCRNVFMVLKRKDWFPDYLTVVCVVPLATFASICDDWISTLIIFVQSIWNCRGIHWFVLVIKWFWGLVSTRRGFDIDTTLLQRWNDVVCLLTYVGLISNKIVQMQWGLFETFPMVKLIPKSPENTILLFVNY